MLTKSKQNHYMFAIRLEVKQSKSNTKPNSQPHQSQIGYENIIQQRANEYHQTSNISALNPKPKCFSSGLEVVFAQSIEARC